jgi:DNA-directed RNA polymerase specialized sigma24 family protein
MISSQAQSELPEATQIQLILDGTAEVFYELVRPHQHVLYLKALSILQSEADAEEVVQNTALKTFNKLCQFRHDSQFHPVIATWTDSTQRATDGMSQKVERQITARSELHFITKLLGRSPFLPASVRA